MSHVMLGRAWTLLLGLSLWLAAGLAHARERGEVSVSLVRDGDRETPAYVCVVSDGQGRAQIPMFATDTATASWSPVRATSGFWERRLSKVPERRERELGVLTALLRMLPGKRPLPDALSKATQQLEDPALGRAVLDLERERERNPSSGAPVCGQELSDGTSYCEARIEPEKSTSHASPKSWDQHHVVCVGRPRGGSESTVLWLEVSGRAGGASVGIDDARLTDGVLTLETNLEGDGVDKHVVVIGGHYLPGSPVVVRDERVELALEPLCRWSTVELPRMNLVGVNEGGGLLPSFTLGTGGEQAIPLEKDCVKGDLVDRSVSVLLPQLDVPTTLEAKVDQTLPDGYAWDLAPDAPEDGRSDNTLEFEATWRSRSAPPRISMRATVLTFFWQREKCFYPHDCPDASIHGFGNSCKKSKVTRESQAPEHVDNGCYYRCEIGSDPSLGLGDADGALEVPVTFVSNDVEVEPRPEWSATVDRVNALVQTRMSATARYIKVDFSAWREPWSRPKNPRRERRKERGKDQGDDRVQTMPAVAPPKPWSEGDGEVFEEALVGRRSDQIEHLTLRDAQGRAYRIDFALARTIPTRGIHYAQIPGVSCNEGLELELEGERDFQRVPVVVQQGSIVLDHPMDAARWLYLGLGADLVAVRPIRPASFFATSRRFRPGLVVSITPRVKFRKGHARSWRFDLGRVDLMLSDRPFLALGVEPGRSSASYESRRYYLRGMGGVVVRSPELELWKTVHLGIAVGLFLGTGRPLFQVDRRYVGGFDMSLTPLVEGTVRLGRVFELRPSFRAVCLEDFHRYSTDLEGRADVRTREGAQCTMAAGLGFAVTL